MYPRFLLVWTVLWTPVTSKDLYVSTPTTILHIDTTTRQTSTIITKENGRLLGLAADWQSERLYYTDVSPQGSGIYTANLQGGDARKLPIQYPDMEPVGLAVDWVYGHLYWTDTVYRAVMMSNLDGTGRVTIVTENLIIPRGIAVDPKRRELYVGDQGNHAVQICGLDGRDCRELNVTDSATFWPNQITIDHVSQRVHWTDGWIPAVYSCAVGGSDCRRNTGNLSADLGSNPAFGIAADQNGQFYLSTLHNQSVYRTTVDLGLTVVQTGASDTKTFFLLNKETTVSQPDVSTTNPCATNKGGCSDICVAHSGNNFTCMCPDGSGKISINSVCQTPDRFLLYTDVSKGILGMASIDDPEKHTTILRAVKPIAVTYHLVEKKVYFADARLRTIYKCDLDGGNIETVLNASHGIGQVEGLSIDYNQNRLYFSNMGFEDYSGALRSWHAIEMLDLNSKKRRTILTSVEKPRAVHVDSENRVLYYTDWGSDGHVGRVSLDGSNRVVLVTAEKPNDLVIHGNKLLVINNREPTAELLELDITSNSGVNRRPLSDIKPLSLSVSGSGALLISSFTGGLGIYTQSSLSRTYRSPLGQFTRMTLVDTTLTKQKDEGPCSAPGTCSDICVTSPKADSFTCLCPSNTFNELSPDRLSCQHPNSYVLFADIDGIKMVSQGNPDDTHVYSIIYPSAACRHFYGLAVDEDQQYIYFSALQGNTIFRANTDGSNVVKFVTEDNSKITSLAMVGSDLFWTSSNSSDNSTGAIYHCDTSDTNRAVSLVYVTSSEPLDIAADESNVYWTERDSPGVRRFDRRESQLRAPVVSTQTSAITLSVPSSHLFYASPTSVTLRRFPTYTDAPVRRDTIGETGARTLMATSQFLYVSVWRENSTGSIIRHNLLTKNRYDVTVEAVRPGQMVYISNQASTVQDKAGSCPSVPSCSEPACSLDVDCYGNSKCCGTSVCTRCVTPDQGTNCIKNGVYVKDSEDAVVVECEQCSCLNGNLTCAKIACPALETCPEESRVKPPGSCCAICLVTTACSRPPTIENCPSSTQTLLLPEGSGSVNITLDSTIFTSMYGKSCSGHKLDLNFPGTSLKWARPSQTVTVTATDKYGSATCSLSVLIIDKTKPTFEFCPSGVLQKYITSTDRIVAWSPVIARDNSGSVKLTSNTENGIPRSPGLHDIAYKAEDGSGNSDQCSFTINVTMLRVCSSPPIPFNGLLRCQDDRTLTCQLEKCNTGYLNTLSNNQQHICNPTDGKWLPAFPSNFSNVCIKPEPIIIHREYQFEFDCPNTKFETSDIKECLLNARLCPSGDVRLCDLPFKRSESSSVGSPNQINIMMSMEGTLPHGTERDELIGRMTNVGKMIEDFFKTEIFKIKCPKIPCQYSKSVTQADIRKCTMGSVMLNTGQEICAPCPAGWFYNENGQCSECPRDTYQERTGQTDCMPCSEGTSSSSGSFLQSHCSVQAKIKDTSQNMMFIVVAAVVGAVVIIVLVSIACFFARKKSTAQIMKSGNFENPVFVGHGANEMSGSSMEVYDQIPVDKMLSESQIQKHKQKMVEEDHYESRGVVYNDDQHTYEGLKGASNKGFNSTEDYDNPREQLLFGNDTKNGNVYSTVKALTK